MVAEVPLGFNVLIVNNGDGQGFIITEDRLPKEWDFAGIVVI
jgi:hypothetical protein